MIRGDRDDKEAEDRPSREACEKSYRQQQTTDELEDSDDPGPHQAVFEADAFEEAPCPFDVAEQDLIAVKRERASGDQADQQLGERRKDRVDPSERRDQQLWRFRHPHPQPSS